MNSSILVSLSQELASRTAEAAPFVVQVSGARRPASGIVHGPDTVITTARALGREDGLKVRLPDSTVVDADLTGWDPATGIALLRTRPAINLRPPTLVESDARPGELVLALARSWSNAITVSPGNVAVVGGPLRTGRRRQISQVIRVTAHMHDGFAGGAVVNASGQLVGVATAAEIRGFGVVIPAAIAWASAAELQSSGTPKRGFIGVAVQPVTLPPAQRASGRERAVLIVGITPSSPAEAAGMNVGDVLVELDGKVIESADDLLDALSVHRSGESVSLRVLRGGTAHDLSVTIAERP